jgi:predicted HicB family RNase H-like nuclease
MPKCLIKGVEGVKKTKEKMFHLSVNIAWELIEAAKIQAITKKMSFQEWISKAIVRQLVAEETALGDVDLVRQELPKQAGKSA